jgi:hypothetical protein
MASNRNKKAFRDTARMYTSAQIPNRSKPAGFPILHPHLRAQGSVHPLSLWPIPRDELFC